MYPLPAYIDRYEIKSLIGRGGMGDLYLARDSNPNTNRLVALKLLNATLDSSDLRERFARESRALAALNHPNIVYIYDSGEFQASPFIVMEYVRGETLAEKIKRKAPMSLAQKLKLMTELCAGLAHAHEAGIIHRDIKPANLMVDHQGRLKILDFGIARVAEGSFTRAGPQMTQVNMRIGTPGYMSPEQIEGGEIDQRSDLFAVGAVCYELLSYREAFSGATTRQIENKVLQVQPAPLASLVEGLDPEIAQIVTRALEKDPDKRYQDAAALEEAFDQQRSRVRSADTPAPSFRATPPPQRPGRQSPDSRAEAAYQRALTVYQEGAHEAARRFLIEALAEAPEHGGALALLERLEPKRWTPPPRQSVPPPPPPLPTVVKTLAVPAARSDQPLPLPWKRHGRAAQVVALLVAVAVVVMVVIRLGGWMWPPRQLLTITRPAGGTISTRGIRCGTRGSDCSASPATGDTVELEVTPDGGYLFGGYTGDCAPGGRTLMAAPRTCGATFEKIPAAPAVVTHVLTITPPKGGTILSEHISCGTMGSDCSAEYPAGVPVTLIARADQGYTRLRFTGDCAPAGQTLMTKDLTCGVTFVQGAVAGPLHLDDPGSPPRSPRTAPRPTVETALSPPTPPTAAGQPPGAAGFTPSGTSSGSAPSGGTHGSNPTSLGPGTLPPPPPISPEVFAKASIEKILKEDRSAYESLDASAFQRVYPTAPVDRLQRSFKEDKSLTCTAASPPEYVQLDPSAGTATIEVAVKQLVDLKAGGPQKPDETTHTMKLSRPDPRGTWHIDTESVKPKR